nr:MAG TPA: hypothetical protein [Caudoviricetes sp.]
MIFGYLNTVSFVNHTLNFNRSYSVIKFQSASRGFRYSDLAKKQVE